MGNMAGKVEYAQFLHDGSEVIFSEGKPADMIGDHYLEMDGPVYFRLPTVQPDVLVPVLEVFLK